MICEQNNKNVVFVEKAIKKVCMLVDTYIYKPYISRCVITKSQKKMVKIK